MQQTGRLWPKPPVYVRMPGAPSHTPTHPPTAQGWARFTTGPFQLLEVEGHHLWPLEKGSKAAWLQVIADQLDQLDR